METLFIPKDVEYKSYLMVMMLKGELDWDVGCYMRNLIDTDLSKFEVMLKDIDKHGQIVYNS